MNSRLLPNRFKTLGWLLLLPASLAGVFITMSGYEVNWLQLNVFTLFEANFPGPGQWFQFTQTNLTNTCVGVLFITGGLMIVFSKEKMEDEFISKLRLSSLLWAVGLNYFLLLLAFLLVQGFAFLTVMVYNMFTILILFVIRFNYLLYAYKRALPDEKHP